MEYELAKYDLKMESSEAVLFHQWYYPNLCLLAISMYHSISKNHHILVAL